MEIIYHSHANKTHFHKKGCAPSLILKVRVFGTRKWPTVNLSFELIKHVRVPTSAEKPVYLGRI